MQKKVVLIFFIFFFIFSFFFILSLNYVSATWIAGDVKVLVNFVPNLERSFSYLAGGSPGNYIIYVKGDLKDFFTLDKEEAYVAPGQSLGFTATLRLPEKIEPGMHTNYICFLQGEPSKGGNIVVVTETCAIVDVKELYSEKKIEIHLNAPNLNVNEEKEFSIDITSWTKQDLSINGIMEIKSESETLQTLKTEEKNLLSGTKETLHVIFNSKGFSPGQYNATATVFYDGQSESDEKTFNIGFLDFEIFNFTKEFESNKISPFEVEIESHWNNKINVYAEMHLKINNSFVKFGETPTYEIRPLEKRTINGYFDATGLSSGSYEGKAVLYYQDKKTESEAIITILPERKEIIEMPMAANLTGLLIAIIVLLSLLIIVGIVLIILRTRKKEDKVKKNKKLV